MGSVINTEQPVISIVVRVGAELMPRMMALAQCNSSDYIGFVSF